MNNRKMSLGQDHSMTPIHDPSTVNLNIPTNLSAANLNSNQQASRDNKSDSADDSKILVAIRIRPLIQKEIVHGELDIIRNEDNLLIVLDRVEVEHEQENKKITDILHRSKEQRYAFDKIFREHSQEQIYQETCKNLIKQVLDGYNACVFAYGPTGTGKTYTMIGNNEIPGLNVLTIRDIFDSIKRIPDREFTVHISYVEIYNETIRDLLVPSSSYLELRDDPIKGIQIAGVTELKVESTEQIINLIIAGNRRRTTEATNANQTSSRSHAVFQIVVTSCPKTRNIEIERTQGKLSLIDLAGSERGTVTENRGLRLREGAKINRSLLALANCINALGDKSKKGFFVPYRDSKLTRLLKDSLGGNSRTVMIANISPAGSQIEETLNTLKYASRAKNIKTKTTSNKKLVSLHVAEYKNIINDLRHEIEQLKSRVSDGIPFNPTPINFDSNLLNAQIQCQCVCGRLEDEVEMKKIQSELFENFQERIQLRRALMELEEQNALNYLEIKRKQAEIVIWKKKDMLESQSNFYKNDGDGTNRAEDSNSSDNANFPDNGKRPLSGVPNEIKQEYKNIQTLRMSTDKNTFKREMMQIQLAENIRMAKQIRDSIPLRVKHQDKRNYLETIIGNHVLELQNIELEIHLQIQEKTMNDLKNIIQAQKKIIDEHKLDNNIKITWENEDVLEDEESHSEGNEMNIDDIVYDDEDEQDPAEEDDEVDFEALEYKDILEKSNVNAYRNANTPSNSKHASHIRIRRRGRSPNNRSLTEHSGEQSNRSRAVSKNKKQVIGFEQNKGVLENNFLADEKKSQREALIPVENELSGSNRSPRIGPTPNKLIENHPHFNSYLANASNNSHKNDTSVLSNVNAPSKDTNLQQPPRVAIGKKTPSSGNNPVPGGNFLPPLNPQGGPASIGISTKSGQNTTGSNSKLAPITNINSLKEQKSDNGARVLNCFNHWR